MEWGLFEPPAKCTKRKRFLQYTSAADEACVLYRRSTRESEAKHFPYSHWLGLFPSVSCRVIECSQQPPILVFFDKKMENPYFCTKSMVGIVTIYIFYFVRYNIERVWFYSFLLFTKRQTGIKANIKPHIRNFKHLIWCRAVYKVSSALTYRISSELR